MSERKGTKALELWCKRLVKDCPDVQIENMTTSWRNGMAFCALVHHFRPDLIDMATLKPENVYENNQLAFSIAEKHLGIPALLDPEDMVANEVPDRLSVLTYLSQFYQRLGHTVNTKPSGNENKEPSPSPTHSNAPIKLGKTGLDKCAACGLPVYLAQRLIVMHKLYHRRCFRCSKCSSNLNTNNFEFIEGSDFLCDSCKNESTFSKLLNNNDQMGMLAYSDNIPDRAVTLVEEQTSPTGGAIKSSILEKISMFESAKDTSIESTLESLSLKDTQINKHNNISTHRLSSTRETQSGVSSDNENDSKSFFHKEAITVDSKQANTPEKGYKATSNLDKLNFLQTQLSGDKNDCDTDDHDHDGVCKPKIDYSSGDKNENFNDINESITDISKSAINTSENVLNRENNETDDIRIAKSCVSEKQSSLGEDNIHSNQEPGVLVPPRKKKLQNCREIRSENNTGKNLNKDEFKSESNQNKYPDHLNPFSDDDDDVDGQEEELAINQTCEQSKHETSNPFGSSDEEDDDVPPIQPPPAVPTGRDITPVKRLIHANPFWSDDEEPSSEDDTSSKMYSSLATSTPNISSTSRRHKKGRAPPPPTIKVTESLALATSMDDVASLSSVSSFNSTVHSDQKSLGKITPRPKKRLAPTPPDSISTASGPGSMDKGIDTAHRHNNSDGHSRRLKGPAPGLPLPERREVKMQISPEQLQEKLDLLETQQLGLERQGVLIEQMIRDKCEGDDSESVPQEEVEDLVIQLCELVNEKNDLFRKQTELMYIRRQQRLEQEQADIEHEIRVIQSQPAVNRCDAEKGREEQLVSRLVGVVRMRDELVQQMDAERRRERREDHAIAACIADRRALRSSESNSSSIKSGEVAVQKKNKVKEKMKKQFKKAKYSLIPKRKSDGEKKEKEPKTEKSPK